MSQIPATNREFQIYKAEKERQQYDTFKVCNPTDEEFILTVGGIKWVFKSKEERNVPRGVRNLLVTHLTDKILIKRQDDSVKSENNKRIKKGVAKMNRWDEEPRFAKEFDPNNKENRIQIIKMIDLGKVSSYGTDIPTPTQDNYKKDMRPIDEQIMDELENENDSKEHELKSFNDLDEVSQ